ncbi:hypothetical protein DV735_g2886, partial [Chaetothyriales sp. CBS 134920]
MDTETPASDSALSELNSEEVESVGVAQRSRSRSQSIMSASSDLSSTAASPRTLGVPPAKRRKTGAATYDPATPLSEVTGPPPRSPTGSISSDTSGSVPNSPSFAHLGTTHPLFVAHAAASANPENPDSADYMQVTRCLWEDCGQPEQGNMDNLVQHIKSVHVVPRQKKYFCQWQGCTRKGQPHTSAYALNAHMRSHTKEKPFFCTLPECDRSFTRSDALAKHMRTVHETEALRPSDPQLGLDLSSTDVHMHGTTDADEESPLPDELADAVDMDLVPFQLPTTAEYWPGAVWEDMDEYERGLPPSQLFELLRRQIYWAQGEGRRLTEELARLRSTAEDTELLLDALLAASVNKTKEAVLGGASAPANEISSNRIFHDYL